MKTRPIKVLDVEGDEGSRWVKDLRQYSDLEWPPKPVTGLQRMRFLGYSVSLKEF
jgi:hypothetical protein